MSRQRAELIGRSKYTIPSFSSIRTSCLQGLTLAGIIFRHASDGRPVWRRSLCIEGHTSFSPAPYLPYMMEERRQVWRLTERGQQLRNVDEGFPSKRGQSLYSPLSRNRAHLLAQLIHTYCVHFLSIPQPPHIT